MAGQVNYRFVPTKRGGETLVFDDYLFRVRRQLGGKKYWRCETQDCKVTAITDNGIVTKDPITAAHCHPSEELNVCRSDFRHNVVQQVLQHPTTSVRRTYTQALNNIPVADAAAMPTYDQLKSSTYRARGELLPTQPPTRAALIIGPPWSLTTDGRRLLLADDGAADKILVFCTNENFSRLCAARTIWMDGTFRSAPSLFAQIYTVHIEMHSQFFPVLMALLPDKQEITYRRFFQLLRDESVTQQLAFQPAIVHCDYEMAVINAVRATLGVQATGCLFHFTQNIYRHMQSIGLQQGYNTDNPPGVRRWLRRIMALPMVRTLRLPGVYQAIVAQSPQIPEVALMHQYVHDTYMDPVAALFGVQNWNVYGVANRTTNMCEGFHSALNSVVIIRHPTVFRLIQVFQEFEAANERNIAQLALGAPPKRKKAKYVAVNEALQRLAVTFAVGLPSLVQVMNYVDAVAYQLWDVKH